MPHKPTGYIIILMTAPSKGEARRIASALVRKKLAACGNIIAGVESLFRWKSKIEKAREVLVLLKTKTSLFGDVVSEIERLHSYEVPEIIAVPIAAGNEKYLKWIHSTVLKNENKH